MACQCGGGDRTAEARTRRNAATVAGVTAGQSGWQRKRSEADRGNSLKGRTIPTNEKRGTQRRRTLKAGTICIDDKSTIDYLLRDLSNAGASLEIEKRDWRPR